MSELAPDPKRGLMLVASCALVASMVSLATVRFLTCASRSVAVAFVVIAQVGRESADP
jgi:hypothetical protein